MTKKDYISIAHRVNQLYLVTPDCCIDKVHNLIASLCIVMKKDNDRFDNEKFSKACTARGNYHV